MGGKDVGAVEIQGGERSHTCAAEQQGAGGVGEQAEAEL